jgi:hypothetical protein
MEELRRSQTEEIDEDQDVIDLEADGTVQHLAERAVADAQLTLDRSHIAAGKPDHAGQ